MKAPGIRMAVVVQKMVITSATESARWRGDHLLDVADPKYAMVSRYFVYKQALSAEAECLARR